jgi:hypothetical protein
MKTYASVVGMLSALLLLSCSKSQVEPVNEGENPVAADYAILLQSASSLSQVFLNEDADGLKTNPKESNFPGFANPDLSYRTDSKLSLFHKTGNCLGKVLIYDFSTDTNDEFELFNDLGSCDITVTAISHTDSRLFVSYVIEVVGKDKEYFVRTVNLASENKVFVDLEMMKRPIGLVPTSNRLFILTFDEDITDQNGISVMEIVSGTLIHEMNLGFDASRIFKNQKGDIIISYPTLHTTLNPTTLEIAYTQYGEGTEPKFIDSETVSFDLQGKMYYQLKTLEGATETIPAVYDFDTNTAVLYYFENFLSESQLNVEFEVSSATSVQYDDKNDLILIGYEKSGTQKRGGLMRITTSPDLTFVDNIDLEGVPYAIFVE